MVPLFCACGTRCSSKYSWRGAETYWNWWRSEGWCRHGKLSFWGRNSGSFDMLGKFCSLLCCKSWRGNCRCGCWPCGAHCKNRWSSTVSAYFPSSIKTHNSFIPSVGLGSDFDGIEDVPIGLEDVSKYPALVSHSRKKNSTACWNFAMIRSPSCIGVGGTSSLLLASRERTYCVFSRERRESLDYYSWLERSPSSMFTTSVPTFELCQGV